MRALDNFNAEITKEDYDNALDIVKRFRLQEKIKINAEKKYLLSKYNHFKGLTKEDKVLMAVSARLWKGLNDFYQWELKGSTFNYESTIEILEKVSPSKLRSYRGVGAKAVEEFKALCYYTKIELRP